MFLGEAQAEVVRRRAELDRRIVAASTCGLSLRAISRQVGLSHTKVQTIVGEAGQALIEYAFVMCFTIMVMLVGIKVFF